MKKIITLVLILTVVMMGIATYAETCDLKNIMSTNVGTGELSILQAKCDAMFKDNQVLNAKTIETKAVSVGTAKYLMQEQHQNAWYENVLDWVTFWN